jgi:hypothetical protein
MLGQRNVRGVGGEVSTVIGLSATPTRSLALRAARLTGETKCLSAIA